MKTHDEYQENSNVCFSAIVNQTQSLLYYEVFSILHDQSKTEEIMKIVFDKIACNMNILQSIDAQHIRLIVLILGRAALMDNYGHEQVDAYMIQKRTITSSSLSNPVAKVIDELPTKYRDIIMLKSFLNEKQISTLLGKKYLIVHKDIQIAKQLIKRDISK